MESKPSVMEISFEAMQAYITELQDQRAHARLNCVLAAVFGLCAGIGATLAVLFI